MTWSRTSGSVASPGDDGARPDGSVVARVGAAGGAPAELEAWVLSRKTSSSGNSNGRAEVTVSEVQRRDVVGVIRVQTSLDIEYLRRWATVLKVGDLLEDVLTEAESPPA